VCCRAAYDIDMSLLDRGLVYELAWQRIRQLLPPTVADKCRMKDAASSSFTTFAPREFGTVLQHFYALFDLLMQRVARVCCMLL
jgi:hypothetical protein